MRELVEYQQTLYTFQERLILGEAFQRGDFTRVRDIHWRVLFRLACIPPRILSGESNYTGRAGHENYATKGANRRSEGDDENHPG